MRYNLSIGRNGELVIPAEILGAAGIGPGMQVAVSQQGYCIAVEPVANQLVNETRGPFRRKASLSLELKQERLRRNRF